MVTSTQGQAVALEPDPGQPCCPPLSSAPVTAATAAQFGLAFKALGDPVRLRLLSMIAAADGGEVCVCALTPGFEQSAPTISHHLKLLREAGLVTSQRRGTWVYYRAVPARLAALTGLLAAMVSG